MPAKSPGPSIKNPAQYEALRDQGMSKEKAARIANSPTHATASRGGHAPPYEQWTKKQLYDQAQKIGISGRSKMGKAQLIDALRHN